MIKKLCKDEGRSCHTFILVARLRCELEHWAREVNGLRKVTFHYKMQESRGYWPLFETHFHTKDFILLFISRARGFNHSQDHLKHLFLYFYNWAKEVNLICKLLTGKGVRVGACGVCNETSLSFLKEGGPEKSRCREVQTNPRFTWPSGTSWAEARPGCWAELLPGRW